MWATLNGQAQAAKAKAQALTVCEGESESVCVCTYSIWLNLSIDRYRNVGRSIDTLCNRSARRHRR